jgi:hypothetical protein
LAYYLPELNVYLRIFANIYTNMKLLGILALSFGLTAGIAAQTDNNEGRSCNKKGGETATEAPAACCQKKMQGQTSCQKGQAQASESRMERENNADVRATEAPQNARLTRNRPEAEQGRSTRLNNAGTNQRNREQQRTRQD